MRHGTRQLSGKRARHGAGHRRVAGFYSAAWPDIAPPLTDDQFASDKDARNTAIQAIEAAGAVAFMRGDNVIPFRKN